MLHLVYAKLTTVLASFSQTMLDKTAKAGIFQKIKICLETGIRLTCITLTSKLASHSLFHHSKKLSHTARSL